MYVLRCTSADTDEFYQCFGSEPEPTNTDSRRRAYLRSTLDGKPPIFTIESQRSRPEEFISRRRSLVPHEAYIHQIVDGKEKSYFVKTGTGPESEIMFKGML